MLSLNPKAIPGLLLAGLCAAIAYAATFVIPLVSAMLLAIIIGMVIRNVGLIPAQAEAGLAVSGRTILRAGVVLLGLRLSIPQVLELGWGVVAVIALTVAGTYALTLFLGRTMGLNPAVTVLTATGTAICGAAAVAAMSAVVTEEDEHATQEAAATAIASVTLFGTLSLVLVPWIGQAVGLSADQIGVWVGAAVHEVGQVVAGAEIARSAQADPAVGAALVNTALVTKLGRVVLLAPLVAGVGAWQSRRFRLAQTEVGQHDTAHQPPIVPLFVLGFLVMVLIRSVTDLPDAFLSGANTVATVLFTMAMVAMGAGVRINQVLQTGRLALALGAGAGLVSAILSLIVIAVLV